MTTNNALLASLNPRLSTLARNRVLRASFAAWSTAQTLKTIRAVFLTRQVNLSYIVASGGMPSSHSALVTALATSVARVEGMDSTAFAIAAILAGIVMYDATGVRLAVSKQARILNMMLDDFFNERGINEQKLHELIGHTPIQVIAGAALGIFAGLILTEDGPESPSA